jgi:calmodulin
MNYVDLLSEDQILDFKEAFSLFDNDNDGTISTNELGRVLKQLGQNLSDQELKDLIEEVDMDKNGEVDFQEFVTLMAKRLHESETEEEVMNSFKAIDTDCNGLISRAELKEFLQKHGEKVPEEELDELFHLCDIDGDGHFNVDEFFRFIYPK